MNPWSFFFIGYVFSQPLFYVTVDGITKGGPAGVLLPAGMKKKYFRKSFSLSMLLSYKSDVTGV